MKIVFKELREKVEQWGMDRDLYHPEHGGTAESQLLKYYSEIGELADAIQKEDREKIKDGIGDAIVCLISKLKLENRTEETKDITEVNLNDYKENFKDFNTTQLISFSVETAREETPTAIVFLILLEERLKFEFLECLEFAYNEIKDRKGKMINRTFVKE